MPNMHACWNRERTGLMRHANIKFKISRALECNMKINSIGRVQMQEQALSNGRQANMYPYKAIINYSGPRPENFACCVHACVHARCALNLFFYFLSAVRPVGARPA